MTREMLLALALGYLFGSIPFGLVLTRVAGKGDIRKIGSGNIGATNVLRTGSWILAALTLVLDCLKATAAILIAQRLFGPETGAEAGPFAGYRARHIPPIDRAVRERRGGAAGRAGPRAARGRGSAAAVRARRCRARDSTGRKARRPLSGAWTGPLSAAPCRARRC